MFKAEKQKKIKTGKPTLSPIENLTRAIQLQLGICYRDRPQPVPLVIGELQEHLVKDGLRDSSQQVGHLYSAL